MPDRLGPPNACEVSILIPVHNRLDLTARCLQSLARTLPAGVGVEVIVYDDCSTDGTAAFLAQHEHWLRVVRGRARGWFSTNINRLAEVALGRWLCLLNNDTILQPNWLAELLATAQALPNAAIVGNYHRYARTGTVNHAGIVFDAAGAPHHLYEGMPDSLAATYKTRRLQAVSAACWLIRADRYADLGGLDEAYRNGWEDLDFSLRAIGAGYEVWYCGRSRIEHFGQSSAGRMTHEDANRRLFLSRWRAKVRPDQETCWLEDNYHGRTQTWPQWMLRGLRRTSVLLPLWRCILSTRLGIRVREQALSLTACQPEQTEDVRAAA